MAKPAQLLNIEPANELKFQGPFRTAVASYMRLTNPTDNDIFFKIKTTAPKKYCVRPNCGMLEPRESQEIAIVLQPFIFDSNEKNKHKFMVQSMVKPDDEEINLEDLWKKYPEKLMDSKLRCVFECPVDSNQPAPAAEAAAVSTNVKQVTATSNEASGSATNAQSNATLTTDEEARSESPLVREMKKMRENENTLRQENFNLREQLLQLRLQVDGRAKEQPAAAAKATAQTAPVHYHNPYAPPASQSRLDIIYIVLGGMVVCFLGILLGKTMFADSSK